MHTVIRLGAAVAVLMLLLSSASAQETKLFNGEDLEGWTFRAEGEQPADLGEPWVSQRGLLICRGVGTGYLIHRDAFEDYALTLEVRTMSTEEGGGMAVGSLGSVYVNAADEQGAFNSPKSIEVSLREEGTVYFRDVAQENRHDTDTWVHRAPDFADDVERDMGEWNQLKLLCHGDRLTVILNGRVVNQVQPINRTKGALALKSSRGFVAAPTFYRNLVARPLGPADLEQEKQATAAFSKVTAAIVQRKAAEEAERAAADRREAEEQAAREAEMIELAKEWAGLPVDENAEFSASVMSLPIPKDAREVCFDATFDEVEFESPSSLAAITKFYGAEMARRGWRVAETDVEEDEATVTFQHGEYEVELNLEESSDGVDVSMECEGLSFEGSDDPAALAQIGVPQPQAYLVLQREFTAPEGFRDQEYDMGKRRLFKSTLALPELYEFLTHQLLQKGYRETRRPIISDDRRYSEFSKGGVKLSVNAFSHEIGSRVVLTYEGQ